jgi:hypothetical protein
MGSQRTGPSSRLLSVDFMRGLVLVIMVLGLICTAAFIVLRTFNAYGNPSAGVAGNSPGPWHPQITLAMSIVSFWIWKSIRHHYNSC